MDSFTFNQTYRHITKRRLLVFALICFGVALLVATVPTWLRTSSVLSWLLVCVFFLVVAIPFIKAKARGEKIDYLEVIYPVSLMFLLDYGLRTIYVFFYPNGIRIRLHPYILSPQLLNLSLFYLILGFICLLWGYYTSIPERLASALPSFSKSWPRGGEFPKVILLYLFGMAVLAYGFSKGDVVWGPVGPGRTVEEFGLHDYVQNFSLYAWYAVAIALFTGVYKRSKGAKMIVILMFSGILIFNLIGGSKGRIFTTLFLLFFWYNYRRRSIGLKTYVILALVALLLVYPWINTYRGLYASRFGEAIPTRRNVIQTISDNIQRFSRLSIREYLNFSLDTLMTRQREIDALAGIIAQTPEPHGYLWGRDFYLIVPWALIPRAVWSNKPYPQDGDIFDIKYWNLWKGANAGPPYIGDLYMNFGLPGILIGMFLTGILLRFIYLYLVKNTNASSRGLLFYMFIAIGLFRIVPEATVANLSYLVRMSFFYLLIIHLFMKLKLRSN